MENNELSNSINEDQENLSRKFLKVKNVKVFSNAYNLRIKEGDVIIGFNGEYFNSSYEDLKKELDEDEEEKILTIFREGTCFNVSVKSSLGITCEEIDENHIKDFSNIDFKNTFIKDKSYRQFEVYKNFKKNGFILDLELSILASIAPPLWMLYHRLWMNFYFTIIFLTIMFMVSPWLFCISWVLKSWYYGLNQINVLRNYYNYKDYRLFLVLSCLNEEEAQIISRKLDPKIDFDYSYLEPPIRDEDSLDTL
ncbi:hypothetical protein OA491_01490 [Alphaproteobacteria bacterium]|nr:hypothetical protein [Alphaproteobacteria bacterium]